MVACEGAEPALVAQRHTHWMHAPLIFSICSCSLASWSMDLETVHVTSDTRQFQVHVHYVSEGPDIYVTLSFVLIKRFDMRTYSNAQSIVNEISDIVGVHCTLEKLL